MKKLTLIYMILFLVLTLAAATASANLVTIGTANYLGSDYNLIWDDDNNGNSVIWLDYSNGATNWVAQNAWAAGLNASGVLTYDIDSTYTVDWGTNSWRLPATVDGPRVFGYDGTTTAGYNITSSEMGHLYYTELGNLGYHDTAGNTQPGFGLNNTGVFNNLRNNDGRYWSGTDFTAYSSSAWHFFMYYGSQDTYLKTNNLYGLAIRSGDVSAVPVPAAIWLLGSGLIAIVGIRRKKG